MITTALTTDGRFPVRHKRPNRPSVDNAFRSSWCPHFGVRSTWPLVSYEFGVDRNGEESVIGSLPALG